jgi:hypothetical protein
MIESRLAGRKANAMDYDRIVDEYLERTPTSAWSPWEVWKLPGVGPMWVRYRTVDVAEHVVTKHHRETRESNPCPTGYWETGGGVCELIDSTDPKDPPIGGPEGRPDRVYVGTRVVSSSDTETDEVVAEWTEFEWDHRVFSKLGKRPKFQRSSRYALLEEPVHADSLGRRGAGAAGGVASGGPKPGGGKYVITLPALLETDRLSIGDSRAKLSVVVDGVDVKPGQALEGHKLGRGFHVVDLEGEIHGVGVGRLQLLLNVVSPVEMRTKPFIDVDISDEDGGVIEVQLSNRGSSTLGVRVVVDSVPSGWMAETLAGPFIVLARGEEAVVPVRVKRMFVNDEAWEPPAFVVRASLAGTRASDAVTTFLARPRGRRSRKGKMGELPAILAPPKSIAPSRRTKATKRDRARTTKSRARSQRGTTPKNRRMSSA